MYWLPQIEKGTCAGCSYRIKNVFICAIKAPALPNGIDLKTAQLARHHQPGAPSCPL
jgi:hypothetical protein